MTMESFKTIMLMIKTQIMKIDLPGILEIRSKIVRNGTACKIDCVIDMPPKSHVVPALMVLAVQRVQSLQVNALSSIILIIEEICKEEAGPTEDHLDALMDAVRLMSMGFSSCNQVRKESIRNALGYPLARFCNWEFTVGRETLFEDVTKKIEERDKAYYKLKRGGRGRSYR